ncbi:MAG: hypothetical protein ACT4PK_11170 [Gammaproteobacteria bacterium]
MRVVACGIGLLIAATLAACIVTEAPRGGLYRLDYLFQPPVTEEGRRCATACRKRQDSCRESTARGGVDELRRCEERADSEYQSCATRTTSFSEKSACYRKSCPVGVDYINCGISYRSCFEACGGQVWVRTVCETNC